MLNSELTLSGITSAFHFAIFSFLSSCLVCVNPAGGVDGPSLSSLWPFSLPVSKFSRVPTWEQTVLSVQKETAGSRCTSVKWGEDNEMNLLLKTGIIARRDQWVEYERALKKAGLVEGGRRSLPGKSKE